MISYLQLENLTKSYGDRMLFSDITFGVNQGDKIGLIAKNGTGKTTLLRIIAGKESPDSGTVRVLGVDTAAPEFRAVKEDVGVVLDEAYYPETLTAVQVGKVMAGKYAAVLLTVPVSVAGAVVSNLAAFAVYGTFWPEVLGLSVLAAVAVPPVFAMLSLPFYYWFGNQIAQFTSLPQAFLFFYIIKNFEDGMWTVADLTGLVGDPVSLLLLGTLQHCLTS